MKIFLSYEHDSLSVAEAIAKQFEANGKICWYAPRDVMVSYAADIVDAISQSDFFVILLTERASVSKHVLNEVECAYKYFKEDKTIIVPFRMENFALSREMEYYVQRLQFVEAYQYDIATAINELESKLEKIFFQNGRAHAIQPTPQAQTPTHKAETGNGEPYVEERLANRYYDTQDAAENRRLKCEAEMLYPIEKKVLDEILAGRENLTCLLTTVTYAPGNMMQYLRPEFSNIIGLSYDEKATIAANYDYESSTTKFYHQDMEDSDLEDKLAAYMQERGISGFDFVDISMGFLAWKSPFKVIKKIKKFLNPNALIFVRDIDDTVLFAYPDDKKLFQKFFTFYGRDPLSGYRQSGRRVYGYLKKAGAKRICLHKKGIDIAGMTPEEKERMFFCYFGFVPNDYKLCFRDEPGNAYYKQVVEWCDEHFDELEEDFMNDDFMFNSGYFIYTAEF